MADAVMHAVGLGLAVAGMFFLISVAGGLAGFQGVSVWIYGIGLVSMFGISAAYNIWPICSAKLIMRRFDHSAIYLFIAATYTPFVTQAQQSALVKGLLVVIWSVACAGVVLKLKFPGRFERLSIMLCLALGWSGLIAYDTVFAPLPASTIGFVVVGGVLYSVGVAFHLWDSLRFQNAIWHAFVLTAAGLQFFAIFNSVGMAASTPG